MGPPPDAPSGPAAPAPPPPAWNPPPPPTSSSSSSAMFTTAGMEAMMGRASRLSLVGWGLGFLLLFVGTLVAAIMTNPAVCFTNTPIGCTASQYEAFYNGLFIGKVLWAIGLLLIGGASGLRLHGTPRPTSGSSDEMRWVLGERWANLVVIVVAMVLLLLLLLPFIVSATLVP